MVYNVVCQGGHVFLAPEGSRLEAEAKKSEAAGFTHQAITVKPKDCPDCPKQEEPKTPYVRQTPRPYTPVRFHRQPHKRS